MSFFSWLRNRTSLRSPRARPRGPETLPGETKGTPAADCRRRHPGQYHHSSARYREEDHHSQPGGDRDGDRRGAGHAFDLLVCRSSLRQLPEDHLRLGRAGRVQGQGDLGHVHARFRLTHGIGQKHRDFMPVCLVRPASLSRSIPPGIVVLPNAVEYHFSSRSHDASEDGFDCDAHAAEPGPGIARPALEVGHAVRGQRQSLLQQRDRAGQGDLNVGPFLPSIHSW